MFTCVFNMLHVALHFFIICYLVIRVCLVCYVSFEAFELFV